VSSPSKIFLFLLILLVLAASLSAQTRVDKTDSLRAIPSISEKPDSLSLKPPINVAPDTSRSDLDAPILYDAHLIDNDVDGRLMVLIGNAVVKYKGMTLEAGKIIVDWDRDLLTAEALPDSFLAPDSSWIKNSVYRAANDSANGQTDRGAPVFSEGNDRMTGERMEFNFKTERGRVTRGRTEFEDGKYSGRQIKRLPGNTLNVSHGVFTTCELPEDPHFHFSSRKMKIVVNEKVIARPIVMYLGKIPVAMLPFGVFPTRRGRHSGLIVPRFGQSVREGRYLRELGYYWAASDYWDARMTVDYYDRSGWIAKAGVNYAWRYHFSGAVSGSLTRRNFAAEGTSERRWDIAINHSQTLGPTASFYASGSFVSDNSFYRDFSFNQNQRLTRTLLSQATFSKSWPDAKTNISVNASEQRDLQDGSIQRLLPQVSFYYGQRQIFGAGRAGSQSKSGAPRRPDEQKWYENIYFGFSSTARHSQSKTVTQLTADSSITRQDTRSAANHRFDMRLNSPKRYFGWLYLSQGLTFNEDWFDRTTEYDQNDSSGAIVSSIERGFAARHTFFYSASANTKLYGTFSPRVAGVKALRHLVTPSMNFSYQPDFSDPQWGYYEEFITVTGSRDRRDRFGGTPRGKVASLSFSLSNLFQMKTGPDDKERKIDLFNLNFFTGYNFAAKEFKLSNLSSTFNANPLRNVSVNMSASHSFYVFDPAQNRTINRFIYKERGKGLLRLVGFNFDASLSLQGKTQVAPRVPEEEVDDLQAAGAVVRQRFETDEEPADAGIPWRANFVLSYNLSKFNPAKPVKTIYLTLSNAEIRLTKNWRISMSSHMDLRAKQVISQSYGFYRDLHCWEAQLRWTPGGPYEGFYFRISIKSPTLQDVKYEHRGGRSSVFGGIY